MFPSRQCDRPDTPVVTTSAAWTLALATAGGTPMLNRKVLELTP